MAIPLVYINKLNNMLETSLGQKMAEQMVMLDLLTNNCGKDCKSVIREQVRKRKEIIIPGFFAVALIISLCIVVGVLHEKKKTSTHMDCVLRPTQSNLVHLWISIRSQTRFMPEYVSTKPHRLI